MVKSSSALIAAATSVCLSTLGCGQANVSDASVVTVSDARDFHKLLLDHLPGEYECQLQGFPKSRKRHGLEPFVERDTVTWHIVAPEQHSAADGKTELREVVAELSLVSKQLSKDVQPQGWRAYYVKVRRFGSEVDIGPILAALSEESGVPTKLSPK
jgi:hypothetical protein